MRLVHKGSLGALPSLCRLALGCAVGVALCAHAADTKQPPRDEKTAPKRGVTIEEQPSRTIIYFEESGGIILPNSKPRAADIRERLPALDSGKQAKGGGSTLPKGAPAQRPDTPMVARPAVPPTVRPPSQPQGDRSVTRLATEPRRAAPSVGKSTPPASQVAGAATPTQPIAIANPSPISPTPVDPREKLIADAEALLAARIAGSAESMRGIESNLRERVIAIRAESLALRMGWSWLDAGDASSARLWFHRALTWQPSNEEAVRGSATAALAEKDYAAVIALADKLPADAPVRVALLRDGWLGVGQQAFDIGQLPEAMQAFANAEKAAALPRYARQIRGWAHLKLARSDLAANEFASLFSESADAESAQGLLAALDASGRAPEARIAQVEPLASMLRERNADRAFAARRVLEAKHLDPAKWADIGTSGTPNASLSSANRSKSGTAGLGQLDIDHGFAVAVGAPLGNGMAVSVTHQRAQPTAGRVAIDTPFGIEPRATVNANSLTAATLRETQATLRYERGYSLAATLVRIGADTGGQRSYGSIDWQATPKAGQVQLRGYKEPVRESVLSWVGMRDQASGQSWGAVDRQGFEARGLYLAAAPFSVGMQLSAERITGMNVEDNRRRTAGVSIGRNLNLNGFAYSSLSIGVSEDRYDRNLNNYTIGHGGYFSPQRYQRVGPAFDFMTAEAKPWIVRGRAEIVRSTKRESSEDVFPLQPNGSRYSASQSRGTDSGVSLAGAHLIGSHVLIGFTARASNSSQFRERAAGLEVRISFDRLRALTSADIPQLWGG